MTEFWHAGALAIICATFVLAGFVKGVVGLGLPTVSLGVLTAVLGLELAILLMVIPSFATNLWQGVVGGALLDLLRRLWTLPLAACPGIWLGAGILFTVSTLALAAALADNRILSLDSAAISSAALAPGQWLRHRLPEQRFRRMFLWALLILGAYIAVKNFL